MMRTLDAEYGGKAAGLRKLENAGAAVPSWFCISSREFFRFLNSTEKKMILDEMQQIVNNNVAMKTFSKQVQTLILKKPMSPDMQERILRQYRRLLKSTDTTSGVAVRSSMIGEDGENRSFAGMLESSLFVKGEDAVLTAIKQCWASAFSERVLMYRRRTSERHSIPAVGVIIQQMIAAEKAGVLFTQDPTCESPGTIISAVNGVAADLVNGTVNGELYRVVNNEVRAEHITVLSTEQCIALTETCLRIEQEIGSALDIEWAIVKKKIYLLQARPITMPKDLVILDNANIIESYYGVTTPLTFSVARDAYRLVYRQFCSVVGVSSKEIEANDDIFSNMIVLVRGRVYYNLTNWYRLLQLLPSPRHSAGFMENMMGMKIQFPAVKTTDRGVHPMIRLWSNILKNWMTIDHQVKEFHTRFASIYQEYQETDLKELTAQELVNCYKDIRTRVIDAWRAPIINDFLAMVAYGALRKMTVTWCDDKDGTLYNGLLAGDNDIVSVKPVYHIAKIASTVRSSKKYRSLFALSEKEILRKMRSAEFSEIAIQFDAFIDMYGYRCPGELKLEENSYKDAPEQVIRLITSYIDNPLHEQQTTNANKRLRKNTERLAHKALAKQSMMRKREFWMTVRLARKYMQHRENMRICRTRIFGVLREIFNSLGEKLAQQHIIAKQRDIFYLSVQEIIDIVEGSTPLTDNQPAIVLRRNEFQKYARERNPPDRIVVQAGELARPAVPTFTQQKTLQGIGCSPGTITGRVKIVHNPQNTKINKDILVAERTDPGWVVIYPLCSGILVERGSILSHSAIIARELGIPAIVGIPGLMQQVKDGQKIRMHGSSGVVELL